jgi:hypothetical protein
MVLYISTFTFLDNLIIIFKKINLI